ncbi:MAG: response regulator transcription factor [Opitutales bacterium]
MVAPNSALIVDDEQHVRLYVKLVLKSLGIQNFYEAENGAAGVESYAQNRPELVLMDVSMPVMDGVAALRKINEADPEALVIMLTSMASREIVEECAENGAINYVRKDVPREELAHLLRETIHDYYE